MKKRPTLFLACCVLLLMSGLYAQTSQENRLRRAAEGKATYTQEELVSFKSDMPYKQAMESLSTLCKRFLKKPIVDQSPLTTPIGVDVQSMYWKDALELILRTNSLWYTEKDDYIQISPIGAMAAGGATPTGAPGGGGYASQVDSSQFLAKTHDVVISAVFLTINTTKQRESGINFSILRGHDLNLDVEFSAANKVTDPIFTASANPTKGKFTVDMGAAINIFESEQIGEVIGRPQTVVKAGSKGRIQIGTDFSIVQKDFSGNLTTTFYPSGIILEITPKVYTYGTIDFIDLPYHAERSTVTFGATSTTVDKTTSDGRVMLLNGEESYVGGLYSNDVETTREGIPLLKDLPWWVFGLRYIFGYDASSTIRKELIILLKAELLPPVEERVKTFVRDRDEVLQQKLKESREEMEKKAKIK